MRNVPKHVPFQEGVQIGGTVLHVLQPRFIFPDKPPLMNDSEVLQKYTGLRWGASSGTGTSVSMGYLAELYVDFGVFGAVVVMFVFGVLLARSLQFICSARGLTPLVNFGLAIMLSMTVMQFEQSLIKMVGTFVANLLTIIVLRSVLFPTVITIVNDKFGRRLSGANPLTEAQSG
jgi:hypothetical protein